MKRLLTDGKITFSKYYWNKDGQIVSTLTNKPLKGIISDSGLKVVELRTDNNEIVRRSFDKLKKFSYLKRHLPKNYQQFVDVFGFQKLYCFDPENPFRVWSKTRLKFKQIQRTQDGYPYFETTNRTIYLHIMVYEAKLQMFIDPEKYQVHHIKRDLNNCNLDNLELLTIEEHKQRHKEQNERKKQQMKGNEDE